MSSNAECLLCTRCVQACEHRGVQLNLRPPLQELWRNPQPMVALSTFTLMLVGIMGYHGFKGLAWWKAMKANVLPVPAVRHLVLFFAFIVVCLVGLALASTLSAAASQERVRDNLARYGVGFIPLAFSGHLATITGKILGGGLYELLGYVVMVFDSVFKSIPMTGREGVVAPFVNPAVITFLRFLIVSGGIGGSLVALVMIARRSGERATLARVLPHLLFLGFLAICYYVIFLGQRG